MRCTIPTSSKSTANSAMIPVATNSTAAWVRLARPCVGRTFLQQFAERSGADLFGEVIAAVCRGAERVGDRRQRIVKLGCGGAQGFTCLFNEAGAGRELFAEGIGEFLAAVARQQGGRPLQFAGRAFRNRTQAGGRVLALPDEFVRFIGQLIRHGSPAGSVCRASLP